MQPWNDKEIARFLFREALFVKRGCSADEAAKLADRLAARDQDKDDRRVCLECKNLKRDGGCAEVGRMIGTDPKHKPVQTILFRCAFFDWRMPDLPKPESTK